MNSTGPTSNQLRLLWFSVTTLSLAVVVVLIGLLLWGIGFVLDRLSPVLLPLAIGAIAAYILDPVVDFLETRKIPRRRGILLVFFTAFMTVTAGATFIVPRLLIEASELLHSLPNYLSTLHGQVADWMATSPWAFKAREAWESEIGNSAQGLLSTALRSIWDWIVERLNQIASWLGFLVGLALVPVYTYYFLLEKIGIQRQWTEYLPIRHSSWKKEVIFILTSINEALIVFFRGQVLVALCVGGLLIIGFLLIGLKYALILGFCAGLLSIIPYLGVMLSIVPVIILAFIQFGDWLHLILVLMIFMIVQTLEGFLITPKIIGDRVGLHPLTVIISVMIGITLMGGLLGGLLSIPLTAALRAIMFRYVWHRPTKS